ncbi:RhuM family protein [Methanoculleus methanifontis]|uniref:RhuM family protein n=1 Tax=Methanoculleus methanifontis TaxID=2584086 RepID=UPI00265ACBD8|nr:RhuM family protein [Methanoculleus sp. FWC-SCC3]
MEDWAKRLDRFLEFDDRKLLEDRGKATKEMAKEFAESEFEKYRVVQDRLFESDFDRMLKEAALPKGEERDNKNNETTGDLK